jgi:hypothetical protein
LGVPAAVDPAIGRIGYDFIRPNLRNPEAGELSRETVAESNDLTFGAPAADTFIVKATKTSSPPCRRRRRIFVPSQLRKKSDRNISPSVHSQFSGTLCRA